MDELAADVDDSPSLMSSVRRNISVVVGFALLGALLGIGLALSRPTSYESTAQVIVSTDPASGDPVRNVATQAAIMTSPPTMQDAAARYGRNITSDELASKVVVEPADKANLISVRASAANPKDAAALANAVVQAYVNSGSQAARGQQRERARQIDAQLAALQDARGRLQDALARDPNDLLSKLRLDAVTNRLSTIIRQRVDLDFSDTSAQAQGRSLGPAVVPNRATKMSPTKAGGVGAFIGLVAGVVLAWWLTELRRRGRPVRVNLGGGSHSAAADESSVEGQLGPLIEHWQSKSADTGQTPDGNHRGEPGAVKAARRVRVGRVVVR